MKSFRLKNIKSFLDSGKIEFAPLTIFVGKNSCGKSSLLRFPVVLAQSIVTGSSSPILFDGKYVDYGFFENVVHNQKGETISFDFSYDVDVNDKDDMRFFDGDEEAYKEKLKNAEYKEVTMRVELGEIEKTIHVLSVTMLIENKKIVTFGEKEGDQYINLYNIVVGSKYKKVDYEFKMKSIYFEPGGFPMYDMGDLFGAMCTTIFSDEKDKNDKKFASDLYNKLFLNANPYEDISLSKQEKTIKEIKETFDFISNVMSHVYVSFREDALTMNYIGPFRDAPSRIYRNSEKSGAGLGVGVRGENVSMLLARDYRRKRKLIKDISKWIESTLGYKLQLEDMNNGFFQIQLVDKHGIQSDISDVGFGISQVLPIVTQIMKTKEHKLNFRGKVASEPIYIEQPELHLHPAAQSKLADLFANCIDGNNASNMVIETHSEHLIRRLQVLISDKSNTLTNDMVKIYYVDKNTKGNATINEMKICENGKFASEWPTGFFDEAHNLTMKLLRNTAETL